MESKNIFSLISLESINILGINPRVGGMPPKLRRDTTKAILSDCEEFGFHKELLLENIRKEAIMGIIVEIRIR